MTAESEAPGDVDLPCPFCGAETTEIEQYGQHLFACRCANEDCAADGPWRFTVAEAVAAWNERKSYYASGGAA